VLNSRDVFNDVRMDRTIASPPAPSVPAAAAAAAELQRIAATMSSPPLD